MKSVLLGVTSSAPGVQPVLGQSRPPITMFLDVAPAFIRPHNTDWRYVRFNLPRLREFCSQIQPVRPENLLYGWHENMLYLSRGLLRRAGFSRARPSDDEGRVSGRLLRRLGADVLFTHSRFPRNVTSVPIVWQNSILDPEMLRSRGVSESEIEADYKRKQSLFERCAAVQVGTTASARRLAEHMPHIADRFFDVPFFLPDLSSMASREVNRKQNTEANLTIAFVGNEARRKGLDLVLSAFERLDKSVRRRAQLHIVSSLADGAITIPKANDIVFHGPLNHSSVMQLLRSSHVLVMPSRFESYGLAFLEAMSCGVVPVGPKWEAQREILSHGQAGVLADCTVASVQDALLRLITDVDFRVRLALEASRRFTNEYSPDVVSSKYYLMLKRSIAGIR